MATYSFVANGKSQLVNWDSASVWDLGSVPNAPDANVVIPTIYPAGNGGYEFNSFITIATAESFAAGSLDIASNYLLLNGALSIANALVLSPGGELDMAGGTLSTGSLRNAGTEIQGSGRIASSGPVVNFGEIVGAGLSLTSPSFQNTGSLIAEASNDLAVPSLTVTTTGGAGSFANFSGGTLTGGTYEAAAGTLDLNIGGTIVTDAASLVIGARHAASASAAINSFDRASGLYLPLQATLRTIAPNGTLTLYNTSYTTAGSLTVAGGVTLRASTLSPAQLAIAAGGRVTLGASTLSPAQLAVSAGGIVTGDGTIAGQAINDGTIVSGTPDGSSASAPALIVLASVTGAGSLTVGTGLVVISSSTYVVFGSTLEIAGATSQNVAFADGTGILVLDDPQSFRGSIAPMASEAVNAYGALSADTVLLPGISYPSVTGYDYDGDSTGGVLAIHEGPATQTMRFSGNFTRSSFTLYAGPRAQPTSPPSLGIRVMPVPAPPIIGLSVSGARPTAAIVNTTTLQVAGTVAAGATLSLFAGDVAAGSISPLAQSRSYASQYTATVSPAPGLGARVLTAIASNQAGSAQAALDLFVLPSPVGGVTTADFASGDLRALLDRGYRMQFLAGTEAVTLTNGTLSVGPDTNEAFIQRLYQGLLGRTGDQGGLAAFDGLLSGGAGTDAAADMFLNSAEYQALHGPVTAMTDAAFLTKLYRDVLGRAPDQPGLAGWIANLAAGSTRAQVAAGFAQSDEAKDYLAASTADLWVPNANGALVTQVYEAGLGRLPEFAGLRGWEALLQGGLTPAQFARDIVGSAEFAAGHAGQTNVQLVTSFYQSGLGRAPDLPGLRSWVDWLQSGATQADVLLGLSGSPEAALRVSPVI